MLAKFLVGMLVASVLLLIVLLNTTTPSSAGATGILAVFVLTYLAVLSALTFFMYGVSRIIVKLSRGVTIKKPLQPLTLKRAYYYSSVIALAPVILTSMQSVGVMGIYEVGLVVFLIAIGCVYVTKRTA